MKKFLLALAMVLWASTAHAAYWYVDNAATGSNNGTSWANAWKSFSNVVWGSSGVKAGDTLFISGGSTSKTYTQTASWPNALLLVGASGSSGSPITIATGAKSPSPSGHDGKVIFDGAGFDPTIGCLRSYIVLDGEKNGASNWELKNGAMSSGAKAILFSNGNSHTGNVAKYLTIHDYANGIYAPYGSNFEVAYCSIYNIFNDHAIRIIANSSNTLGSLRVHHNTITTRSDPNNNWYGPDGVQVTYAADIYNNTFNLEHSSTFGGQHPDHIQSDFHLNRIYNNTFNGGGNSVMLANFGASGPSVITDFWFCNNIVRNPGWIGVNFGDGSGTTSMQRIYILNNTFVDCNSGMKALTIGLNNSAVSDFRIENNIFYNCGGGSGDKTMSYITAKSGQISQITFDYNLINPGAHGTTNFVYNGSNVWTQAHGQTGAPKFAAYTEYSFNSDLHLLSSDTAARNNGANFSSVLSYDKDGVARPASSAWDIGAYQFSSSQALLPPVLHQP